MDSKEPICAKFNMFTKNLIRANLLRQKDLRQKIIGMNEKAFAKEFCTVRMSVGRGSGNTFTACDIAVNMFQNPLLLVQSHALILPAKRQLERITKVNPSWESSVVLKSINEEESFRGLNPDSVIVDATSLASQSKIDDLYKTFGYLVSKRDFCFILLG